MKCINTKCIRNTCSLQPVVIVALVLNGTNIYGYMRCRWNSSESDPVGTITSAVGLHMLKSVSFLFACFSLSPCDSWRPSFAGLSEYLESLRSGNQRCFSGRLRCAADPERSAAAVYARRSLNRRTRVRGHHCFQHCLICLTK